MIKRAGELIVRKILVVLFLLVSFPIQVFAAEKVSDISVSAKAAVLYDPVCESVVWGKNEDLALGMASTTKIMTAIVAMERYDLAATVEIRPEWCGIEGSSMYLTAGESLSVKDLLYGLLLASGNDAATALAGLYTGNQADFVACMNEKAHELGLQHTAFRNPSGLSEEGHHTTALELAKLAAYAMEQPLFAEIVSATQYTCGTRTLQNHNKLLQQIDACGVKTGYTKADGRCLVSAKEEDGRMLIAVTLSAPDDWSDHRILYETGFSNLTHTTPVEEGTIHTVPVVGGTEPTVSVYCADTYTLSVDRALEHTITVHIIGPRFVYQNEVKGGQPYGTVQVRCNNTILFESTLYYANSVESADVKITFWQRFANWLCCLLE